MNITGCLMVKNEEKNIERCIRSFMNVVKQIVVVDTGSEDKTIDIAKRLGAEVYHYKWDDNFSNPRNFAIEKAKGDWIIFLDADEYFVNSTELNIRKIINRYKDKKMDGIIFKRTNIDIINNNIIGNDYMLRVFKNDKNIRYKGKIHEVPYKNNDFVYSYIDKNDELEIYHTGYGSEFSKFKFERNLELLEQEINDGTANDRTYFHLSDCYLGVNKPELCIKYSRLYLQTQKEAFGFNSRIYSNLIESMMQIKEEKTKIFDEIKNSIDKFPCHPEFYRLLGRYYYEIEGYEKALISFEKAIELNDKYNNVEVNTFPNQLFSVYFTIGIIYEYKNNYVKATEFFINSLLKRKNNYVVFEKLIAVLSREKTEDILWVLKTIYNENDEEDIKFIMQSLLKIKHGELILYYYNIWKNKFNNDDISLMFVLLANGHYDNAFDYFYEAYKIDKTEEYEILTIVAAILSNDPRKMREIKGNVSGKHSKIIDVYMNANLILDNDCIEGYCELLNEIAKLSVDLAIFERFLDVSYRLKDSDFMVIAADILKENKKYEYAIQMYSEVIKNNFSGEKYVYFRIGYCYYKMLRYNEAKVYFDKALECGYNYNNIKFIMNWMEVSV